jgi:nucleoside-diphosphate-sugar epimerase
LEDAMTDVEYVYHCAGKVSFQPSDKDIIDYVNVAGTANVVNLCIEKGIKKLCHVSSVAALGRTDSELKIDETSMWKNSEENSVYSISKYGGEREVWRSTAEGLNVVIVNPGLILGPGNWKTDSSMIFRQVWKGLRYYTSGVHGMVDVKDVSKAMIALMNGDFRNERYILVAESKPLREVFDRIADKLGKKRPDIHAGPLLTGIAWRIEYLKSLFLKSKPIITRETSITACGKNYYSNEKIKKAIGMEFLDVMDSVDAAADAFLDSMKNKK